MSSPSSGLCVFFDTFFLPCLILTSRKFYKHTEQRWSWLIALVAEAELPQSLSIYDFFGKRFLLNCQFPAVTDPNSAATIV